MKKIARHFYDKAITLTNGIRATPSQSLRVIRSKDLRSLLDIFYYFLSVVANSTITLIPSLIIIHLVYPTIYAQVVIIKSTIYTYGTLAGMGISQSVIYFLSKDKERGRVFSTSLHAASVLSSVFFMAILASLEFLGGKTGLHLTVGIVFSMLCLAFAQLMNYEVINWARAENNSKKYMGYSLYKAVIQVLSISIFTYLLRSAEAYIYGLSSSECLLFLYLLIKDKRVRESIQYKFDFNEIKKFLTYGWPHALIIMFAYLLNTLDRYLLTYLQPDQSLVAFYDASYIIASSAVAFFSRAFNLHLFPAYIRLYNQGNVDDCIKKIESGMSQYIAIGFIIIIMVSLFKNQLVSLLFPPQYLASAHIIPIIAVGTLIAGLLQSIGSGVYVTRSTWRLSVACFLALLFNAAINLWLIPKYLLMGAAYSTILTYILQMTVIYYLGRKQLPIKIPITKLIIGIGVVFAIFILNL